MLVESLPLDALAPGGEDSARGGGDVWNIRIKGARSLLGNEKANDD